MYRRNDRTPARQTDKHHQVSRHTSSKQNMPLFSPFLHQSARPSVRLFALFAHCARGIGWKMLRAPTSPTAIPLTQLPNPALTPFSTYMPNVLIQTASTATSKPFQTSNHCSRICVLFAPRSAIFVLIFSVHVMYSSPGRPFPSPFISG